MWWPKLDEKLQAIKASGSGHAPRRRTDAEKIDELLDLTRQLMRRTPEFISPSELPTTQAATQQFMDLGAAARRRASAPGAIPLKSDDDDPFDVSS